VKDVFFYKSVMSYELKQVGSNSEKCRETTGRRWKIMTVFISSENCQNCRTLERWHYCIFCAVSIVYDQGHIMASELWSKLVICSPNWVPLPSSKIYYLFSYPGMQVVSTWFCFFLPWLYKIPPIFALCLRLFVSSRQCPEALLTSQIPWFSFR